jgi:hypothetical protein
MSPYLQILRQPVLERRNQGSLWLTWVLLVLGLGGGAVTALLTGAWAPLWLIGGIALGALILLWGMMLFSTLVRQNSPINVRLLPGLNMRLRLVAGLTLVAVPFCLAIPFGIGGGHFGYFLSSFSLSLIALSFIALATRYSWIGFLPLASFLGPAQLGVDQLISALKQNTLQAHWIGLSLAAVLTVLAVRQLLPRGFDEKWDFH